MHHLRAVTRGLRRANTSVIQLLGNIAKGVFEVDFLLRRERRFRIPEAAAPFIRSGRDRLIPRIVWQTNYARDVTMSVYANYLFNRVMAPSHEFRFLNDADCEAFIAAEYPLALTAYRQLQIGAAKADLWRAVVLLVRGGVYIDADAAFSCPPEWMIAAGQTELFARDPDGRLTNYFMAAAPANPVMQAIVDRIVANVAANVITSVFDMTGPTVVHQIASDAAVTIEPAKLICRQGQITTKKFQYPDRLRGYWALEEKRSAIVAS